MPMRVGRPVKLARVSDDVRKILELGDYKDGDPVPENLADIVAEVQKLHRDVANLPLPVDPRKAGKLQYKEVDVNDLPPEQRAEYDAAMRDLKSTMTRALSEAKYAYEREEDDRNALMRAEPGVRDVVAKLRSDRPDVVLDEEKGDAPAAEPEDNKPEKPKKPTRELATDADLDSYALAIASGNPWSKTFKQLNGRLLVTYREAAQRDVNWIANFCNSLARTGERPQWVSARFQQMLAAVQLHEISGLFNYRAPDETQRSVSGFQTPGDVLAFVQDKVAGTESVWRIVNSLGMRFQNTLTELEVEASFPDFS